MNKRTGVLFVILLLLVAVIAGWKVVLKFQTPANESIPALTQAPAPQKVAPLPVYSGPPFSGTQIIQHDRSFMTSGEFDGPTQLDAMTHAQIASYRKEKVRQYETLNLFPPGYEPFRSSHNKIYGQITPRVAWVTTVPYYVANPYILLSLTHAGYVAPFTVFLNDVDILYSNGKITETHRGRNFAQWKSFLAHRPGSIAVTMTNAWDAGFYFIHLVEQRSENVMPATAPSNVGKSFYTQSGFYHVGQHHKNNLSPDDRRGHITLRDSRAPTKLVFLLWRSQPVSLESKPDLVYEMVFSP